jgi:hypothetical protein
VVAVSVTRTASPGCASSGFSNGVSASVTRTASLGCACSGFNVGAIASVTRTASAGCACSGFSSGVSCSSTRTDSSGTWRVRSPAAGSTSSAVITSATCIGASICVAPWPMSSTFSDSVIDVKIGIDADTVSTGVTPSAGIVVKMGVSEAEI